METCHPVHFQASSTKQESCLRSEKSTLISERSQLGQAVLLCRLDLGSFTALPRCQRILEPFQVWSHSFDTDQNCLGSIFVFHSF